MHVDDFLDMAKRHGYIKDDSDLNENTFISVMQGLDVTYEKSGAVKMLHHVAHRLSLRNLLKNVWDNNEYRTYLRQLNTEEASNTTEPEDQGLIITRSINQIRTPIKKSFNMEGWKRIPSMADLAITLDEYNIELARIGFSKRLPTKLEFIGTSNAALSTYMIHCIKRLNKKLESKDTLGYWNICRHLLRNSIAFRTSAVNKVLPNWWHAISLEKLARITRRVDEILSTFNTNLLYKRQYLPEPNKIRPLGVPAPEWRIVMHMINNFLVQFLKAEIIPWNHGFIPRRGTISAIKDLIFKAKKAPFIYEFDFKNFFGNVDPETPSDLLFERGVPHDIVFWLESINFRIPQIPNEVKLDQDKQAKINQDQIGKYSKDLEATHGRSDYLNTGIPQGLNITDKQDFFNNWEYKKPKGLPQGLNTSPIMSIFSILNWIKLLEEKEINPLMFADDGFLLGQRRFELFPPIGHEFHESKSRWVKETKYGETFTMPLYKKIKFLGVEIDFENDTISGNTRKGNKLTFSMEAENLAELIGSLFIEKYGYSRSKLENIASSGMWGFILSKLYTGSWGRLNYEDKKWRQHKDSWWVQQNGGKKFNIKKRDRVKHRGLSSIAVNVLIEMIKKNKTEKDI